MGIYTVTYCRTVLHQDFVKYAAARSACHHY